MLKANLKDVTIEPKLLSVVCLESCQELQARMLLLLAMDMVKVKLLSQTLMVQSPNWKMVETTPNSKARMKEAI